MQICGVGSPRFLKGAKIVGGMVTKEIVSEETIGGSIVGAFTLRLCGSVF
jgi:hypothetical protein